MGLTPAQQARIKRKIANIKAALAADKKQWGGYHRDGRGLRYTIPALYIQLEDYKGGLSYLNWFKKTFPDDICFPEFLFEWTIILFKTRRLKAAEKKAFETFCGNTYLFQKYFLHEIVQMKKREWSNLENTDYALNWFQYTCEMENLGDFSTWLESVVQSEKFQCLANEFVEIHKRLLHVTDQKTRSGLLSEARALRNQY